MARTNRAETDVRPRRRDGGVRHGLVFRSIREGREIRFELENPEYEPCPDQLMLDEKFREDLAATS